MAMKKYKVVGTVCSIGAGREMGLTAEQISERRKSVVAVKGKKGIYVSSKVQVFEIGEEIRLDDDVEALEFFERYGLAAADASDPA